jgi:hypothetical protein
MTVETERPQPHVGYDDIHLRESQSESESDPYSHPQRHSHWRELGVELSEGEK